MACANGIMPSDLKNMTPLTKNPPPIASSVKPVTSTFIKEYQDKTAVTKNIFLKISIKFTISIITIDGHIPITR